jgi:hypothetical protein
VSSTRVSPSPKVACAAAPTLSAGSLFDVDADVFRECFDRHPFRISHRLVEHPLLTLPSLIDLSKRLPEGNIRYNRGDVPPAQQLYAAPKNDLSIEETIRQIEHCGSWMVIRFIEQDAVYRELLNQCLNEIQPFSEAISPGMCRREGFIFITSPDSITPFHADPESNFLLQIRGSKSVTLFDVSDRSIVPEEVLERFLSGGGLFGLEFKSEFQERGFEFDLSPGDGLHFPPIWPHWVKNGGEFSISLSITFRTHELERSGIVYSVNHRLRKRGFNPTPYGKSAVRDAAKFYAFRAARRARKLLKISKEEQPQTY